MVPWCVRYICRLDLQLGVSQLVSLFRCVLSDPPALPHAMPDRSDYCGRSCRTTVAVHLHLGFFLPTDQGSRTRSVATSTSHGHWNCFECNLLLWLSEFHGVSRFHQSADASQYLFLTKPSAHKDRGPILCAVIVTNSNVSLTDVDVDNVFCFLPSFLPSFRTATLCRMLLSSRSGTTRTSPQMMRSTVDHTFRRCSSTSSASLSLVRS